MILRTIQLENFGLYAGVNEFDLVPRRQQCATSPIILIGGRNGAGKTTLLEAVRLALYGRRTLGTRVSQAEYDQYLRSRINRGANIQAAAVGLEFDYAEAGVIHRYRVRREWTARGKSIVEALLLEKDGSAITSVPRDEWHSFLQELIPPGVSQLFFFDGEKISEIAEGEQDNEQLADAVRGLLGIELVGRLRLDLGLYLARHRREDNGVLSARIEAVSRDIAVAEKRISDIADEVAGLTSQRDSQARAAEQVRRQFISEGGDAALQRAKTESEREEVSRAIARAEHELRDLANRLLPFAMAPRLVKSFRDALARASGQKTQHGSIEGMREAIYAWRAEGSPKREASWSAMHWADLERFLAAHSSAPAEALVSPAIREVGDGATTLARLIEVETIMRPRAAALRDELDALHHRNIKLETMLERADNAAAGVLLDELRLAEQRVGATEAKLKARQEELKTLRGQLVTLLREQKQLLKEQESAAQASERAALAARAAQALADYEQRLLDHKLAQLRGEFVQCFNRLVRKSEFIAGVAIDPLTFTTTLIDKKVFIFPKDALSAGEKQIYAIAMLWALARTSGRPLPMIIDTPLARLDSEHRAKLIQEYFSAASHQVVLLSTDTEIDEQLKDELGTNVSHTYLLEYNHTTGQTTAFPGYFDEAADRKERQHALQQA